jgi:hypothetical protein
MRIGREFMRWGAMFLAVIPLAAGPPFLTDDPEPVELSHLELYLSSLGAHGPSGSAGLLPEVEFNYGILPDTQFHIVAPYAYSRPEGGIATHDYGDTEVGIKFRFVHETDTLPQIGIFPLVELPTGNADHGLGAGHTQIYLPLWIQKSWGKWTTYGGYGWWRNPGAEQRNWSYTGWLLQRDLSEHITLGGEVYHQTAATLHDSPSSGGSLGMILNLSDHHHILMSAGKNVSGNRDTHFYVGYQFTGTLKSCPSQIFHRADISQSAQSF